MELYVLDDNLEAVGIIQGVTSLIWANRYRDNGDCELYIPASADAINLLSMGRYLERSDDDDMVCIIKKMTVTTSAENGNYIAVEGYDAKSYLDQRVVWDTATINGGIEAGLISIVNNSAGNPTDSNRQLQKGNGNRLLYTESNSLAGSTNEQISYKNVGQVIRDHCQQYGWGYYAKYKKASPYNGAFVFGMYEGTDRSANIIFSRELDNLNASKHVIDDTMLGNVALVAGEGEGSERVRTVVGSGAGTARYELYVDAKDLSKNITYSELTAAYTGGSISLQSGHYYYIVSGTRIAEVPSASPSANDTVVLEDSVYEDYLSARGADQLAEYGEKTTFEGSIVPFCQFVYGTDYFLGDIVTIKTDYGVTATARIIEVVEVWDRNGYSLEPKFEYITISRGRALLTENGEDVLTEDNRRILLENQLRSANDDGIKISELDTAVSLDGTEYVPMAQNGDTVKASMGQIASKVLTGTAARGASIPFGKLDNTSTATVMTATVDGITELVDGTAMFIKNGVITSASGVTLNINGLGAKPIYQSQAAATAITTQFNISYTALLIYDSTRIEGGAWIYVYGYNSDTNTIAYHIRNYQAVREMKNTLYRYMFVFTDIDGKLIPSCNTSNSTSTSKTLTTDAFNPHGEIFYYSTTTKVDAGSCPSASYLYKQYSTCNMRYGFNVSTSALTVNKPVYIKCSPQTDGRVKLAGNNCITQTLPSTEDGYVYIFIGYAYSAYQIDMPVVKPIYYYKDGAIREWT